MIPLWLNCPPEQNAALSLLVVSLMESKHQQKAAIHIDAVKAELKSGLMEGWKSSLDQNAVRFRLGGKSSFSDQKASATLTKRDETLLMQLRTGEC